MIFKKINNLEININLIESLSNKFNINKKVMEILFNRGINTEDKINKFLYDDINNLKDPFLLHNMKDVVARIKLAIKNNEKILLFGDYDTDGICGVSILYNYLLTKTNNVITYLPNRFSDGYGLSCPCIDKIAEEKKPDLFITIDCGISCKKEVDYIKNMGVDVIVTDHHELPNELPNCLILNTKFDQPFNFKGLCGAGVSFKLVQALCYEFNDNFEKYLPICAIATIADIVPLIGENRIIVKEGLKRLKMLPNGISLLLKKTFGKTDISSTNIAFKIAPILNSAGRLDDANISLNLFISNDLKLINNSLNKLNFLNEKRKEICNNIYDDACKMLENNNNNNIIILYNKNWDIGVLGIVCAKLCETFNKPTILFGENNGELKGSGRSVGSIDIFKLFSVCSSVLNNFGGHVKAGGLSLNETNLKNFINLANNHIKENYTKEDFILVKEYDLELTTNEITTDFIKDLKILEPLGHENNSPIFKINLNSLKVSKMKNNLNHLLLGVNKNFNLISFNDDKNYENYLNFNNKEFLLELEENSFNSKNSVKGIVRHVNFSSPNKILQSKLNASLVNQLFYEKTLDVKLKYFNSITQLNEIIDDKTLIISYNINNKLLKEIKNVNIASLNINKTNTSTLVYGLESFENLNSFKKIVFLETPLNFGFIKEIKNKTNATIFVPKKDNVSLITDYFTSREELLEIYYKLVKFVNKIETYDLYSYYEKLMLDNNLNCSYTKFYIAIKIFEELKIITKISENSYKFKINKIKTDLNKSYLLSKINI